MGYLFAGVDEVGRGPLAGPVVAAAVILDNDRPIEGLMDSKILTPARREFLYHQIQAYALSWAIGRATVEEIDQLNIFHASLLAMQRAVEALPIQPGHILVDGKHCPKVSCSAEAIIKGDATVPAISAASIMAKVTRDREMVVMDDVYPGYGLATHKGYPTAAHIDALGRLGITPIHRRSFRPVRELCNA